MEEIWKDVVGYEGRYLVSNLGNIRSTIFSKDGKAKNIKLLNGAHYLIVRLQKNGVGSTKKVHRLVAEAFLENPNNYPVVNHKNLNKHDNRVDNLEWCTYSYNNTYRREIKTKKVICVETGMVFDSSKEAAQFASIERSGVTRCCLGRQLTSGGYHWKYMDKEESKYVEVVGNSKSYNKNGLKMKITAIELDKQNNLVKMHVDYFGIHKKGHAIIDVEKNSKIKLPIE